MGPIFTSENKKNALQIMYQELEQTDFEMTGG